jgi:hypothetical protein
MKIVILAKDPGLVELYLCYLEYASILPLSGIFATQSGIRTEYKLSSAAVPEHPSTSIAPNFTRTLSLGPIVSAAVETF